MSHALIVYTSLTGNTEKCVQIVQNSLEKCGIQVKSLESVFADPQDFLDADICLVGTYTYGIDGALPDEMVDFYEELAEVDLSGKIFGTFGSGDLFYGEYYCKSVDDFTDQFLETGAVQGAKSVKIDLDPEKEDTEALTRFAETLVRTLNDQNN